MGVQLSKLEYQKLALLIFSWNCSQSSKFIAKHLLIGYCIINNSSPWPCFSHHYSLWAVLTHEHRAAEEWVVPLSLLPALGPWPISSPASRQDTPAGGQAATPLETKKLCMGFGSFYTKNHGAVYCQASRGRLVTLCEAGKQLTSIWLGSPGHSSCFLIASALCCLPRVN